MLLPLSVTSSGRLAGTYNVAVVFGGFLDSVEAGHWCGSPDDVLLRRNAKAVPRQRSFCKSNHINRLWRFVFETNWHGIDRLAGLSAILTRGQVAQNARCQTGSQSSLPEWPERVATES